MKRAARIVFHLAAGVSLLLFIAGVAFWVSSEHSLKLMGRRTHWENRTLGISGGRMLLLREFSFKGFEDYRTPERGWYYTSLGDDDFAGFVTGEFPGSRRPVAGCFFGRTHWDGGTLEILLLPLPFVVLLFALLPLAEVMMIRRRRRRVRRRAAGLCVRCGYDLRATPDKCPECGAVPVTVRSV
jgi:hypothetical protein